VITKSLGRDHSMSQPGIFERQIKYGFGKGHAFPNGVSMPMYIVVLF
jgi:hypothetical protein